MGCFTSFRATYRFRKYIFIFVGNVVLIYNFYFIYYSIIRLLLPFMYNMLNSQKKNRVFFLNFVNKLGNLETKSQRIIHTKCFGMTNNKYFFL